MPISLPRTCGLQYITAMQPVSEGVVGGRSKKGLDPAKVLDEVTSFNAFYDWLERDCCPWIRETLTVNWLQLSQLYSDWLFSFVTSSMAVSIGQRVFGVGFVFLLLLSATLGSIFLQSPMLPLLIFFPVLYKDITNFMISTWLILPPSLIRLVFGTRIRMFGSQGRLPEGGWNVIVMNHRTRLDWFYLWMTFLHTTCSPLSVGRVFKIVLKSSLRHLPGFGWAMQASRFLFLDRNWEKDKLHLTDSLNNIAFHAHPHSILIFPEGTDFEPKSLASSHSFAKKNNLPLYHHVLHPRVTGTIHTIKTLVAAKSLERIVNVTVYYPDFVPTDELSLLRGQMPKEIWYFVDIIPLDKIPGAMGDPSSPTGDNNNDSPEDGKMASFLQEIWARKEAMLDTLESEKDKSWPASDNWPEITLPDSHVLLSKFIVVYWIVYCSVAVYLICTSSIVFWYTILIIVGFLVIGLVYGGLDKLEVRLWKNL
jgi:lysocardiolipin and lysophospholipid acyltransferase